MSEYKLSDPRCTFHYFGENDKEWLGVELGDCKLAEYDTLWIKSYRPRRGGDHISQPPSGFTEKTALRLPIDFAFNRLLHPKKSKSRMPGGDLDTVWFGLDIRDWDQTARKDLNTLQSILIPCDALKAKEIPGFEGGCTA